MAKIIETNPICSGRELSISLGIVAPLKVADADRAAIVMSVAAQSDDNPKGDQCWNQNGNGNGIDRTAQQHHTVIRSSLNYMMQHLSKPLRISTLSALTGVSTSYFYSLFKHATGRTPLGFFIHARMRRACELLEGTDLSVKEIAASMGYDDPFYFSRIFKSVNGVAPREYRTRKGREDARDVSGSSSICPSVKRPNSNWREERSAVCK